MLTFFMKAMHLDVKSAWNKAEEGKEGCGREAGGAGMKEHVQS